MKLAQTVQLHSTAHKNSHPTTKRSTMVFFSIFSMLSTFVLAAPHPSLQNITVTVPEGTSDHGDSRLLCTPTKASDIFTFFVANYFTHAFSIVPMPGEVFLTSLLSMANALFYPVSGVHRGVEAMRRMAILRKYWTNLKDFFNYIKASCQRWIQCGVALFPVRHKRRDHNQAKTRDATGKRNHDTGEQQEAQPKTPLNADLRVALKAGALCEVIRTHGWKPKHGEETCNVKILQPTEPKEPEKPTAKWDFLSRPDGFLPARGFWSRGGREVHGCCHLPKGYALAILPAHAEVEPPSSPHPHEQTKHEDCLTLPSYSHSPFRIVVAIVQLYFSISTLVSTRGDQIFRYGYAAFGLTVVPYLLVSAVNLLGSLVTPTFDRVYLIETSIMKEARSRGGYFGQTFGNLVDKRPRPPKSERSSASTKDPWASIKALWRSHLDFFLVTIPMSQASLTRLIIRDLVFSSHDLISLLHYLTSSLLDCKLSPRDLIFLSRHLIFSLCDSESSLRPLIFLPWYLTSLLWYPKSFREFLSNLCTKEDHTKEDHTKEDHTKEDHTKECPFTWPVDTKHDSETYEETDLTVRVPFSAVEDQSYRDLGKFLIEYCCMLIGCVSLAVIGAFSYFEAGGSSEAQRGWTMAWLATGISFGSIAFAITLEFSNGLVRFEEAFYCFFFCMAYSVPAIGGMVIVGQMIWDYGSCSRLY